MNASKPSDWILNRSRDLLLPTMPGAEVAKLEQLASLHRAILEFLDQAHGEAVPSVPQTVEPAQPDESSMPVAATIVGTLSWTRAEMLRRGHTCTRQQLPCAACASEKEVRDARAAQPNGPQPTASVCPECKLPIPGICVLRNSDYGVYPVTCSISPEGKVCCSHLGGDHEYQAVPVLVEQAAAPPPAPRVRSISDKFESRSDSEPHICANCARPRHDHYSGPYSGPGEVHCSRYGVPRSADPNIIRAAEGVTLTDGRYEVLETHQGDDTPALRKGERFSVSVSLVTVDHAGGRYWQVVSYVGRGDSTWVTAVRRVDAELKKPEPDQQPAKTADRPIVVGSTWRYHVDGVSEPFVITEIDSCSRSSGR